MENQITGQGLISSEDQQQLVDKLCKDYRENLIRRFQQSSLGDTTSDPNKTFKKPPPEVLGANALIAEHLHNHGYFISQSVFSAEIEFPGKGNQDHNAPGVYRLKQSDVEEIVGALEMSIKPQEITELMAKYNKDTDQSLLSTMLAHASWKKSPKETTTQKDLMAFNKYLKILVSRIAKVSMILSELKRKRLEMNKPQRHVKGSPSRSRHNRRRQWENSQIKDLAKKIEKLTIRLSDIEVPLDKGIATGPCAKSYRDWIKELKSSRHGQRMIRKIERIIVNSLNKEQAAMQNNFDEKLSTQRMILKLHYKQKFLEHFQALNLSNEPSSLGKLPLRDVNGFPGKILGSSSQNKKKQANGKKAFTSDTVNYEKKVSTENHKLISNGQANIKSRGEPVQEGKENCITAEVKPKDEDRLKEKAFQEREIRLKNVEKLINDAKTRIKVLQSENERLDQSFNTYLERQSSQADHFQKDVSAVWASYNVDRLLLEKRRRNHPQPPSSSSAGVGQSEQQVREKLVPEIRIEKCKSNLEVANEEPEKTLSRQDTISGGGGECVSVPSLVAKDNSSGEFSNPFINFDVKKFLESTTRVESNQEGLSKSAAD